MVRKSGLGRGLSALIPSNKEPENPEDRYEELSLDLLIPNPEQPRHTFHQERLHELADSIRHNGVIQPIIVTPQKDRYIVIAGERRWRATKLAGYEKIPAIVRKIEKGKMLSLALLENIQRQELNPIEEALAYRRLLDSSGFTHETLARNLGKNRVTITNTLRLLKLSEPIRDLIQDNRLSFGHARCLVPLENEDKVAKLAENCIEKQWSVRELEKRIQKDKEKKGKWRIVKSKEIENLEKKIGGQLNAKVAIAGEGKKGKIAIIYDSESAFRRIIATILNQTNVESQTDG